MPAFHNDPQIKAFYLARVAAHRDADEIRHGYYWEHGKGCAVGCTLHTNDHNAYESELGIPRILAQLEDGIFESLTPPHDLEWPHAFLEAIPVGSDLALVWPRFFLRLATDANYGVLLHVQDGRFATRKASIEKVVHHFQQWITTGVRPATTRFSPYNTSFLPANADAADAAYAAASAVAAADDAYIADAHKREEARIWQSQILLSLLREAPMAMAPHHLL